MVSLQERQRASETLFGSAEEQEASNSGFFNLNHNLQAYNKLVQDKYSDTSVIADADVNIAPRAFSSPVMEAYSPPPVFPSIAPPSPYQPVQLDSYYMPEQTATPVNSVELDRYHNDANPLPTFRPKMFDQNLEEIDHLQADKSLMQIAEVPVEQEAKKLVTQPKAETTFETNFKLNGKGMLAVIGFIAVTALVIALIIVNSISISGAGARIDALRAENAESSYRLRNTQQERDAERAIAEQAAHDTVFGPGRNPDGSLVSGFVPVPPQTATGWGGFTPAPNPDAGGGFFDNLSRFFSRLFGGN